MPCLELFRAAGSTRKQRQRICQHKTKILNVLGPNNKHTCSRGSLNKVIRTIEYKLNKFNLYKDLIDTSEFQVPG